MSATIIAVASSVVSLAVSIGLAYAAGYPGIGNQVAGRADVGPVIVYAAAVAIVLQWVAFIPAFAFQTEKYYDLTGSVTYISVTLATLAYRLAYSNPSLALNVRALVSSVLVVLWALRLGSFLVKRIMKAGKDGRFDEVKPFFARFLAAWTIQGLWVFLTLFAVLVINTTTVERALVWTDYLGWGVWAIGFCLEVVSDEQKTAFNKLGTGKWVEVGLWRYSRHPNYFGEIVLWTGQFIVGTSVYRGGQWAAVLSPLFVTLLLTKVTGIPMLEKRADEKWGGDPEYEAYKRAVSVLVLLPRRKKGGGPEESEDYRLHRTNSK